MELYEAIRSRRSIRRFKSDEVPDNLIVKILEAARWAPSWQNNQCWEFIVVKDRELIKQLTKGNVGKIFNAPIYIVACAEPAKSGKRDAIEYYIADVANALENLLLAATAEGLGTCWIGDLFQEDNVRKVLGIPLQLKVVAITPLGYPAEGIQAKISNFITNIIASSRTRKELSQFCHLDKFSNPFPKPAK